MWNREGEQVSANYLGLRQISGRVTESRVSLGGRVLHTVRLDHVIDMFGAERDTLILSEQELDNPRF